MNSTIVSRRFALAVALAIPAFLFATVERPKEAAAGCQITVTVRNTGTQAFTVDWEKSKVKIEGGLWDKLAKNSMATVQPGQSKSIVYGATFNCGANRRYQVVTVRGDSERTTYLPGESTWTTSTTPTANVSM